MTTTEQPKTAKRPKRKRKWRRRILTVLFLGVLLITLAPLALALGPVRDWVADKVGEQIGRRVEIDSASAFWFQGVDLEGITVHSPEGFDKPLATVEKVHADLDVLGFLRGKGGATVEVTRPHVTLLRNERGGGNADGIVETVQGEANVDRDEDQADAHSDAAERSSGGMRIAFRIIEGRVEASTKAGAAPHAISHIDVDFRQEPEQAAKLRVSGRLEGMSVSGGDVELRAATALADGKSPFEFTFSEAVDLARLAPIVEGAAAIEGLSGSLRIDVKGTASGDGGVDGKGTIQGQRIALRSQGGLRAYVGRIDLTSTFTGVDDGTQAVTRGTLNDVRLEQRRNEGAPVSMTEPTIRIDVQAQRSTDGKRITVDKALVKAGATLDVQLTEPIRVTLGDTWAATGVVGIRSDLGRLGALESMAPQLAKLRGGQFSAQVKASTAAEGRTRIAAGVRIVGLQLDADETFARGYAEPQIDAQLLVSQSEDATRIEIRKLAMSGVSSNGSFTLGEGDTSGSLVTTLDLGAAQVAQAFLASKPGEPPVRIAGRVVAKTQVAQGAESTRVTGDVQGTNLELSQGRQRPFREPTLRVDHDVTLPGVAGPGTLHKLSASLGALRVDASGSTWTSEPEPHVDAKVVLSGQSDRIVALLETARGQDFEDLKAAGPVSGTITVRGPATKAEVLVNGRVDAGTWESAGFVMSGLNVTIQRNQPRAPLTAGVRAQLNGGTFALDTGLTLTERDEIPWTLRLNMAQVDTSKVLVSKGAGRYMSFLLPSLIPAGSKVSVMTGKLDATASFSAQDVSGPLQARTLQGTSTLRMVQGEIRDSTLFGGGGGSPQMNKLMGVLGSVAPDVRSTMASISKALVFSSLDSRARVANQIVYVDALDLTGPHVQISSKGTAHFVSEQVALQTNVVLVGSAGKRVAKVLPDRTIPLQVTGPLASPQVTPRLDPGKLIQGGVMNEGKKLLEGLTGGKGKKKNPVDRLRNLLGK